MYHQMVVGKQRRQLGCQGRFQRRAVGGGGDELLAQIFQRAQLFAAGLGEQVELAQEVGQQVGEADGQTKQNEQGEILRIIDQGQRQGKWDGEQREQNATTDELEKCLPVQRLPCLDGDTPRGQKVDKDGQDGQCQDGPDSRQPVGQTVCLERIAAARGGEHNPGQQQQQYGSAAGLHKVIEGE